MATALSDQTDHQLLTLFQRERDPDVFRELVVRHHGLVFGVAHRVLRCPHASEDVVQATFLVLIQDVAKIRKRTSLSSWLYGVAFRIASRLVRQRSRARLEPLESEVTVSDDPLELLNAQFEQSTVLEELYALSEKLRAPLVMRYLQGMTNTEVAEELRLTQSAVEGRLKRGRNQLRLRLARQGVAFSLCVGILNGIREEAQASEMTQLVADTVSMCTSGGTSSGGDLTSGELNSGASVRSEWMSSEAVRLANEEITRMMIAKLMNGVGVAIASLCVVATGLALAGNVRALAQEGDASGRAPVVTASTSDPFDGETIAADPFAAPASAATADPFAAPRSQSGSAQEDPFDAAVVPPAVASTRSTGEPPSSPPKSKWDRLKALGHYGMGPDADDEIRILEALAEKTNLEVMEEPLQNVMAVVSARHNLQIVFDHRALEDEGIDPSSDTLSISIANVRLQSALNLALQQLDLSMVPRDEVLMITTKSAAEGQLTTRVYRLPETWPLVGKELKDAITPVVMPDSWDEVGGPGSIQIVPGGLIVSNTHAVHLGINKLFAQFGELYGDGAMD